MPPATGILQNEIKQDCETKLLDFTKELSESMESGKQTDIVIMDFTKAFDKVGTSLLLHKLHHYGATGHFNKWIKGTFGNRQKAVVVGRTMLDSISVEFG